MILLTFCCYVFDLSEPFECYAVDFIVISKRFSVVCDEFFDFVKAPPSKQNAALTDGALSFVLCIFCESSYLITSFA